MDSRERSAVNKAVSQAMDAVNARQDAAILELKAEIAIMRNILVDAGIWPKVEHAKKEKKGKE